MRGFEHGVPRAVVDVGTRGNTDTTHLGGQGIGAVVAVQVQRGHHGVLLRVDENFLQEGIADAILDDDAVGQLAPGAIADGFGTELAASQVIAPVAEATFGELHDIALVHQGHIRAVRFNGILDSRTHQTLRAFLRYGLDAETGGLRETNLVGTLREFGRKPVKEFLCFGRAALKLDTGVDIFRILAEDNHIHLLRGFHRGFNSLEVAHRAHAAVEVEPLAERHIQRTYTLAHRRSQRSLDTNQQVAESFHGLIGQPGTHRIKSFLAGQHLLPNKSALIAIGCAYRGINHALGSAPDIRAGAVADDMGDDGEIRHIQPLPRHGNRCSFAHNQIGCQNYSSADASAAGLASSFSTPSLFAMEQNANTAPSSSGGRIQNNIPSRSLSRRVLMGV